MSPKKATASVHDVSQFKTVGEWYGANRGRVPTQMAAGLEKAMRETGLSFPETYALLVARGAIIEIPQPDAEAAEKAPSNKREKR
jgi:hypothetical protein